MTLDEQIAHIEQRQAEVRRYSAEMYALSAKDAGSFSPMSLIFAGMIGGAMCFFAGMTTAKLIGI